MTKSCCNISCMYMLKVLAIESKACIMFKIVAIKKCIEKRYVYKINVKCSLIKLVSALLS